MKAKSQTDILSVQDLQVWNSSCADTKIIETSDNSGSSIVDKDYSYLVEFKNAQIAAKAKAEAEAKAKAEAEAKAKAKAAKKKTITCIKGKLTKKVTGVNPKCPTGYRKK